MMHYLSSEAVVDTKVWCMPAMSDKTRGSSPRTLFRVVASRGGRRLRGFRDGLGSRGRAMLVIYHCDSLFDWLRRWDVPFDEKALAGA
jgi:hypothetical protein